MHRYENIISNKSNIDYFKKTKRNNKVAHAYIVTGPMGSGKKLLAYSFAKALQCNDSEEDACHMCESCIQMETNNNPDIKRLYPTKEKSISVDDIREQINNDILIKPYAYKHKIYIIEEADIMTAAAQNALLKTLEEPPSYAVIILLVQNVDSLLSTIQSRCITVHTRLIHNNEIIKYLIDQRQLADYKARVCANFSQGILGAAIKLAKSDDFIEMKNSCIQILSRIKEYEVVDIIEYLQSLHDYKKKIMDYLDIILIWYRDVLMVKSNVTMELLQFHEEQDLLLRDAKRLTYKNIKSNIETIQDAKRLIDSNVNQELTLELMFTKIKENV